METVLSARWSNLVWARVVTDEGLVGLGESFRHARPVAEYLHDQIAPYLLGRDPRPVNAHAAALVGHGGMRFAGYPTRSVEIRANSAVDMALWDIRAQAAGLSVCEMLGGPMRETIPIYNTCAGPGYNSRAGVERARLVSGTARGFDPEDDLALQIHDPGALAASLLEEGVRAMKIWPFDEAALREGGARILPEDLRAGLARIASIRDAVGDAMDVMLEYHALWRAAPAARILREADAFDPFWHEDPISMSEIAAVAELRAGSKTPFAGSENHGTAIWVRDALAAGAIDYVHFDLAWSGGISEAVRVAHLAAAHDRLIAPHDCTGPVTWVANLHLALAMPNALMLESVRAYWRGDYRRMVTALPEIADGSARGMAGTGLGTALSEELLGDPGTQVRVSTA